MAKASRHKRGGRTTPKGTQPSGQRGRNRQQQGPNLVDDARLAVRDSSPIALLAMASGILELCTPRPSDSDEERDSRPVLIDTLHSFVHSSPDLTAVAAVIGRLVADDELSAHIADDVANGRLPAHAPGWIGAFDGVEALEVLKMTHPYGDGDDYVIGVHWPTGEDVSAVIYIDHNIGSAVKDAFLIPDSPDGVRTKFTEAPTPGVTIDVASAADARARIAAAIAQGELTEGIERTGSWPASRSIIEWMISKLPDGGTGYDTEPISDDEETAIIDGFIASPYAAELDLPNETIHAITQPLVWFAHDSAGGDALRVSPITVDILMDNWYVTRVTLPTIQMILLPMVLKAWTRYVDELRGVPSELTDDTLKMIDQCAPEYLRAVDHQQDADDSTHDDDSHDGDSHDGDSTAEDSTAEDSTAEDSSEEGDSTGR